MTKWLARVRKHFDRLAKSQGITPVDLAFMLDEFFRIAALDNPEADYTMDWIAQTNNEWLRQKTIQEGKVLSFRSIIKIDRQQHSIDLVIILLRSDDTYDIAERLWRDEE